MKSFVKKYWISISLAALVVVLGIITYSSITSVEQSIKEGEFHPPQPIRSERKAAAVAKVAPTTTATKKALVEAIQPWMTFDYVNVVYKLPENYMKDILGVNDSHYPNIRIDTYAKHSSIDTQLLLTTVRTYVTNYQNR